MSLADAECREDPVQNVVSRGGAGDRVDRRERGVQVEQNHLMRDAELHGALGVVQRIERFSKQVLVTDAGDKTGLLLHPGIRRYGVQNASTQFLDTLTRES